MEVLDTHQNSLDTHQHGLPGRWGGHGKCWTPTNTGSTAIRKCWTPTNMEENSLDTHQHGLPGRWGGHGKCWTPTNTGSTAIYWTPTNTAFLADGEVTGSAGHPPTGPFWLREVRRKCSEVLDTLWWPTTNVRSLRWDSSQGMEWMMSQERYGKDFKREVRHAWATSGHRRVVRLRFPPESGELRSRVGFAQAAASGRIRGSSQHAAG
jgi:hypothetical protein